jgi:hypothetical protein
MTTVELRTGPVVRPTLDSAAAEVARLINRARAELLSSGTAVTLEVLAESQGRTRGAARQWVTRHRAANALVTVTHDGNVLVPTFQLDAAFDLDPDCRDVISRLRDHGMDGWAIWDWAQTPNTWLDGDTPAERLDTGDLDAVHHAITGLFQQR